MKKLEIYQVGKLPPLTVVECDDWDIYWSDCPRLRCYRDSEIIAEFFVSNIAGFKEV